MLIARNTGKSILPVCIAGIPFLQHYREPRDKRLGAVMTRSAVCFSIRFRFGYVKAPEHICTGALLFIIMYIIIVLS